MGIMEHLCFRLETTIFQVENRKENYYACSGINIISSCRNLLLEWYDKFFEITEDLNIELHTSLPNVAGAPYDAFDRVVYHLHSLEQLYSIRRQNCAIVRVVFVVTENFTEDLINRIAVFCANSDDIDELSFRQMVDNHYQETYYCHDYLKAGHKKLWWYIEQNDYNLYYCQNKVYTEYKNIGR